MTLFNISYTVSENDSSIEPSCLVIVFYGLLYCLVTVYAMSPSGSCWEVNIIVHDAGSGKLVPISVGLVLSCLLKAFLKN